jgi:fumarate hydratase class II
MNVNEVLANRASELLGGERGAKRLVHPNDDVNLGQSSNDVFPTAMHIAAVLALEDLLAAVERLRQALREKSAAFEAIVKIGRTHLQDATPLTLGQEFSGYVAQLEHAAGAIRSTQTGLHELAIGGTAVGTGLNTHPDFAPRVCTILAAELKLPFAPAANVRRAGRAEPLVFAHGALKTPPPRCSRSRATSASPLPGALGAGASCASRRTSPAARSCREGEPTRRLRRSPWWARR